MKKTLRKALVILSALALSAGILFLNIGGLGDLFGATIVAHAKDFDGEGTQYEPYLIKTAEDWRNLCNNVNVPGGNSYSGVFFKLTNDISVSGESWVGNFSDTSNSPFSGIFDGDNHVLTVDLGGDGYLNAKGIAPFRCVNGATIQNLYVEGSVIGGKHSAGLVGIVLEGGNGVTVNNVTVNVDVSGAQYHGGIVGHSYNSADKTTKLINCSYGGSLQGEGQNDSYLGGMVGWGGPYGRVVLDHCSFVGTATNGKFHPVAFMYGEVLNNTVTFYSNFYTIREKSSPSDTYTPNYTDKNYEIVTITYSAATPKTDLRYNGSQQELLNAGSASQGTVKYKLDGQDYSESIPKGKDPGEYIVWSRLELDGCAIGTKRFQVEIKDDYTNKWLVQVRGQSPDGYIDQYEQGYAKLVDQDFGTSWCSNMFADKSYAERNKKDIIVARPADTKPFLMTKYTLTTANDAGTYGERNWKAWRIYGTNDKDLAESDAFENTEGWALVDQVTDYEFEAGNSVTEDFLVTGNATAYTYYKLILDDIKDQSHNTQCMAEWKAYVGGDKVVASAEDVNAVKDGGQYGINVTVGYPATGYTIKYGTTEGVYDLDESPKYSDFGENTVYYQVSAPGYETKTGSAKITIAEYTPLIQVTADSRFNMSVYLPYIGESKPTATYGGDDVTLEDKTMKGKKYGAFTIDCAAKEMADDKELVVKNGENEVFNTNLSVATYLNILLKEEEYSAYHNIAIAMLRYGTAAQIVFDYNTDEPANKGVDEAAISTLDGVTVPACTTDYTALKLTNSTYYGMNMSHTYDTTLLIAFTITGDAADAKSEIATKFGIDEAKVEVDEKGKYLIVKAESIPVKNLANAQYTVDLVPFKATDYLGSIANNTGKDEKIKNLTKALYAYYLEAGKLQQ